ncbi:hypothetical protein EIQ06_03605, partial [Xanthomonas campestris pv. campestris]
RLDGIESDPQGISTALEQAFGLTFPLIGLGPARRRAQSCGYPKRTAIRVSRSNCAPSTPR